MIIYALLFWAIVNAEFAWTFFLVGLTGTLIISVGGILESYKHMPVSKIFDIILPYFLIQITFGHLTWRLLGFYILITAVIIHIF
ncbi:MAG: hypothetical protein R8N50_04170 [Alphaproteobacteria bacterium]|nr:hypothetical protein [Alphaproteobacteria bacterium]